MTITTSSYISVQNKAEFDRILGPAEINYDTYRDIWKEGGREKVLDILTERVGEKQAKVILEQVPVTFLKKMDLDIDIKILRTKKGSSKTDILHEGLVYTGDLVYLTEEDKKLETIPEARIYLNYMNLCGLLAINGVIGTGKTTAVRIFMEGCCLSGIPVIALDVEGDLKNMYMINKKLPFYDCKEVFNRTVNYYHLGSYKINLSDFKIEELVEMIKMSFPKKLSSQVESGLHKTITRARTQKKHITWKDLIESAKHIQIKADARETLLDILIRYNPRTVLRGEYPLNIKNMLTPIKGKLQQQKGEFGKISIIDVRGLGDLEIKMVIYYLFRKVLEFCTAENNTRVAMFFDESTLYMEEYKSKINDFVHEVAQRGRKRGILLGLVPRAIANLAPGAKRELVSALTFNCLINKNTAEKLSNWGVPEKFFEYIKLFRKKKGGWCLATGRICKSYFLPATSLKKRGIDTDRFDLESCIPWRLRLPLTREGITEKNVVKQKITI